MGGPRQRRSSILGSLRHGGSPPGGSKRCRQARPLTRRVDSADESDRGAWVVVNAEPGRSRQRGIDPPLSRAASPLLAGYRWLGGQDAAQRFLLGWLGGGRVGRGGRCAPAAAEGLPLRRSPTAKGASQVYRAHQYTQMRGGEKRRHNRAG